MFTGLVATYFLSILTSHTKERYKLTAPTFFSLDPYWIQICKKKQCGSTSLLGCTHHLMWIQIAIFWFWIQFRSKPLFWTQVKNFLCKNIYIVFRILC